MAKFEKYLAPDDEERQFHDWKLFLNDRARILTNNGWIEGKLTEFCMNSVTVKSDDDLEYIIFLDQIKDVERLTRGV